jgi:hypothetical protein
MAARLRKNHQDEVRAKIQASQLINVLQNHALGTNDTELSQSRLKAIEILLRKSVPDLSAVQVSGDEDNPLHTVTRIELAPLGDDSGKD